MHIVKHSASWCGPCKAVKAMLSTLGDIGVEIKENDIDENHELARQHGVRGVPTMIAFDGDRELGRKVGAVTKEQFLNWINSIKQEEQSK